MPQSVANEENIDSGHDRSSSVTKQVIIRTPALSKWCKVWVRNVNANVADCSQSLCLDVFLIWYGLGLITTAMMIITKHQGDGQNDGNNGHRHKESIG